MKTFRSFLAEVSISKFVSQQDIDKEPDLAHTKITDIETHYTKPLNDTHSLVVMFNPNRYNDPHVTEVHWALRGPGEFPREMYTPAIHKQVMLGVSRAIKQHMEANPHITHITSIPMSPAHERGIERALSQYPGYSKIKTPHSSIFGTHQHTLHLPRK